jgi:D-beta-D-heptose 7-phosphate kinase/D-beta-D-heptose 1-phosphate adenosyltransferase
VLVVGDVMLDHYIWGDATRISPEAPVPVVQVERETYTAGGAANVALNVRALGAGAMLFGRMGDDDNGRRLAGLLRDHGVEVAAGCVVAGVPTIVKTRVVCRNQQLCRLDREADPAALAMGPALIQERIAPLLHNVDAVVLSDYAKGVLTTESIAAIQGLSPRPKLIALDPKPRRTVAYSGLDVMTPNRSEALQLAGIEEDGHKFPAMEVCTRIHERYRPKQLVVTLGGEGMLLSEGGKVLEHIPTVAREVFDVSGAGDTVIAALTMALAAGLTLSQAARFANTAAGVVVGKLGTATATPEELLAYVEAVP